MNLELLVSLINRARRTLSIEKLRKVYHLGDRIVNETAADMNN